MYLSQRPEEELIDYAISLRTSSGLQAYQQELSFLFLFGNKAISTFSQRYEV